MSLRVRSVPTPAGLARVHLHRPGPGHPAPQGSLVLGHGAGGGVGSADLQALTALTSHGWCVALVEQPWRVAGRRVATPPVTLDAATRAVLDVLLRGRRPLPRPLVLGGRSAGARVGCRLSTAYAVDAVLALSFPLTPPRQPGRSRADELRVPLLHGIPVLVVQGRRDPFGAPERVRDAGEGTPPGLLQVHEVPGDHRPTREPESLVGAVTAFVDGLRPDATEPGPSD